MNNWQWDHVAQQNPATIYPTGWLEAYKHKRLRSEWRYFVSRVKARQWRSARNTFNGYLAEHDGHPHNAGRGWTKRAAERRVNRLCDEAMLTTLAEWWPEGGDPPLPTEPAVGVDRSDIVGFRDGSPIRRHPESTSGPAASDDLFTDDDVTLFMAEANTYGSLAREAVERGMAAVAPSIAAHALRKAADDMGDGYQNVARALCARADQLEGK